MTAYHHHHHHHYFDVENDAAITFEQDQEQNAEQNAEQNVDQANTIDAPVVAVFGDVNIAQVNVADQDIDQDIDQDQFQVIADVAANALAGEDNVGVAFADLW